jgi:hypothetical protein
MVSTFAANTIIPPKRKKQQHSIRISVFVMTINQFLHSKKASRYEVCCHYKNAQEIYMEVEQKTIALL